MIGIFKLMYLSLKKIALLKTLLIDYITRYLSKKRYENTVLAQQNQIYNCGVFIIQIFKQNLQDQISIF